MTVGIFGGTFAPVHIGHMMPALKILDSGMVDEIWLMPCRQNPLKRGETQIPDNLRIQLLDQAVNHYGVKAEKLKINDLELKLPSPSYTINTMNRLSELNPELSFRLLIGGDSYVNFRKWKDHEILKDRFRPIVYPRPGSNITTVDDGFEMVKDDEIFKESSTEIRQKLKEGELPKVMMPWLSENDDLTKSLLDCFK